MQERIVFAQLVSTRCLQVKHYLVRKKPVLFRSVFKVRLLRDLKTPLCICILCHVDNYKSEININMAFPILVAQSKTTKKIDAGRLLKP